MSTVDTLTPERLSAWLEEWRAEAAGYGSAVVLEEEIAAVAGALRAAWAERDALRAEVERLKEKIPSGPFGAYTCLVCGAGPGERCDLKRHP